MNSDSVSELKKILEEDSFGERKNNPQKWAGFVESTVVNFFEEYKMEKLSIEDGNGNRAKLSRTKDNSIKIQYLSTVLMWSSCKPSVIPVVLLYYKYLTKNTKIYII